MKKSHPRQFPSKGGNHVPQNSGIFSKSGSGQKSDGQPKPSYGSKSPKGVTRSAVDNMSIKVGMKKG